MSETKKPSAAELARREAQSAADTGTPVPVDVDINGVTVTVSQDSFDDFETQDALLTANDPDASEEDQLRAVFSVFKRMTGSKRRAVLDALRNDEGRVPSVAVAESLQKMVDAVRPN